MKRIKKAKMFSGNTASKFVRVMGNASQDYLEKVRFSREQVHLISRRLEEAIWKVLKDDFISGRVRGKRVKAEENDLFWVRLSEEIGALSYLKTAFEEETYSKDMLIKALDRNIGELCGIRDDLKMQETKG